MLIKALEYGELKLTQFKKVAYVSYPIQGRAGWRFRLGTRKFGEDRIELDFRSSHAVLAIDAITETFDAKFALNAMLLIQAVVPAGNYTGDV